MLMLYSIALIALRMAHGEGPTAIDKIPKATKEWFENLSHSKQKETHLHFYLHDIVSGPNPTNIPIAMANSTARFGLIGAIDDPLTAGPSPDSEIVGRAQGLVASSSLEEITYHMTMDLVFTVGEYNGSTLSVVGHNPFLHEHRELSVVGGTGVFRLARGTAILNTLTYNATSGDAVVEYNVAILHY